MSLNNLKWTELGSRKTIDVYDILFMPINGIFIQTFI